MCQCVSFIRAGVWEQQQLLTKVLDYYQKPWTMNMMSLPKLFAIIFLHLFCREIASSTTTLKGKRQTKDNWIKRGRWKEYGELSVWVVRMDCCGKGIRKGILNDWDQQPYRKETKWFPIGLGSSLEKRLNGSKIRPETVVTSPKRGGWLSGGSKRF